jgi:uncharacterized protein YjbJ (UPF0337 family)
MFVVTESDAAIRTAYDQGGELSTAIELRTNHQPQRFALGSGGLIQEIRMAPEWSFIGGYHGPPPSPDRARPVALAATSEPIRRLPVRTRYVVLQPIAPKFVYSALSLFIDNNEEFAMATDRVKGAAHQAKGAVKEAAGKVTGDKKTQAEGATEKAAGKVQNAAGGVKDAVKK